VTNQESNSDKDKSGESVPQSALPADISKVTANKAIDKKDESQSIGQETNNPKKSWKEWRVFNPPYRWWSSLENADKTNRVIAIATVVIAISAFVQIGVVIAQWQSGDKQTQKIIDTAQQIQMALDMSNIQNQGALTQTLAQSQQAMETSNKQSKAALDTTIRNSRLDERPWVVLRQIAGIPELDKPWNVQMFFVNTGKTPARNVRLNCHTTFETTESAVKFGEKVPDSRPALIAPNDLSTFCVLDPLAPKIPKVTRDVINILTNKTATLFVYGFVTYDDISGLKHWLTFCRIMEPDGKSWEGCQTHNDTGDGDPPPN
jgi:hypothetical protein